MYAEIFFVIMIILIGIFGFLLLKKKAKVVIIDNFGNKNYIKVKKELGNTITFKYRGEVREIPVDDNMIKFKKITEYYYLDVDNILYPIDTKKLLVPEENLRLKVYTNQEKHIMVQSLKQSIEKVKNGFLDKYGQIIAGIAIIFICGIIGIFIIKQSTTVQAIDQPQVDMFNKMISKIDGMTETTHQKDQLIINLVEQNYPELKSTIKQIQNGNYTGDKGGGYE